MKIHKCACAGSRRPRLRIIQGDGLADILIQTAGQTAGKLAAQAPSLIATLLKDGQAALVPLYNQALAAAPGAVIDVASTLANKAGVELGNQLLHGYGMLYRIEPVRINPCRIKTYRKRRNL